MTYCASYPRYASPFERRPLFRDILSQAGFAFVSVAFVGAVGACLIYARPGGIVQVGKAPQIAMAQRAGPLPKAPAPPRIAATPRFAPSKIQIALRDVMFSLDFPPAPLAQSAPRGTAFEQLTSATQLAKIEAETVVPAPVPLATDIAENVPLPARRPIELSRPPAANRQLAQATPAPTTPAETSSIFDKLFGAKTEQPKGPVLAYANPEDGAVKVSPGAVSNAVAPAYDKFTAIYDISARVVYLPNGTKLEAHSGLREYLDDPRYVSVRMRGATPPATYDLKLRESLFHGVEALRLTPIDSSVFGRAGLLAHTYMLGPNGDSNGCVSFRNYEAFLQAFKRGEVKRLAVVARLN
ncbi:MAG: hypothetical protein QOG66_634 [Methylobacteriaceae bacterium]|jgi:hypothetical protein|nr:hypothetical protein [Methylobacteriaceae bacterium]